MATILIFVLLFWRLVFPELLLMDDMKGIDGNPDPLLIVLNGIAGTLASGLLGFLFAKVIGLLIPKRFKITGSAQKLRKVTSAQSSSGDLFLGIGTVDSESTFIYYLENEKKEISPKTLSIDNNICFIEITDETEPRLETYKEVFALEALKILFISSSETKYRFYIPANSLPSEFKI